MLNNQVYAADGGNLDGIDPGVRLMYAANEGSLDGVQKLLDSGVDVNFRDINGRTALDIAACQGFTDITSFLLQRSADVGPKHSCGSTVGKLETMDHGITVVGLVIPDANAILIACDGRVVSKEDGQRRDKKYRQKVSLVEGIIITGDSGYVRTSSHYEDWLHKGLLDGTIPRDLEKAVACFAAHVSDTLGNFQKLDFLIGGIDHMGKPRLWEFEQSRGLIEVVTFTAIGPGGPTALKEALWVRSPDHAVKICNVGLAVEKAFRCLLRAALEDDYTGRKVTALVMKPGTMMRHKTTINELCMHYQVPFTRVASKVRFQNPFPVLSSRRLANFLIAAYDGTINIKNTLLEVKEETEMRKKRRKKNKDC
ncbi:Integrin-linked protein kinase 1 [Linum perenne]